MLLRVAPNANLSGDERRRIADCIEKLQRERNNAVKALENELAKDTHSCHEHCQVPLCVMRRERDEALAEVKRLKDGTIYCDAYLLSEKENERLLKIIKDALKKLKWADPDVVIEVIYDLSIVTGKHRNKLYRPSGA